ncbi:S-adenosyl-L-methionine-dependent methyltransferase [Aspergillus violaceofuscus CBS 115571]|uniref:phosphoethanolamine N-methyltransferase n=1 Tax=Aspergillus violaceofuscus (strain CBS 115571) TaxID=1450538 RepID=A0A2V5II01_ASPV1|nr:S-adenosyl-L-methionine-dependent methyltransferase [Aspergillus violaceofuscus CBS 115571]
MTITADSLFDEVGASYEAAFADNGPLCAFIHQASKKLPPNSRVLDVGCGTGKPVAEILVTAGHEVHGIDISPGMVKTAASQVRGQFEVANMNTFQPCQLYGGVFAILSLFQLTPGELYSMIFRFAEWLNVGGHLALAVTPSTGLLPEKCTYDPTWDCVWMIGKYWMGNHTNEVFRSEDAWARLLQAAGLVLEIKPVDHLFCPAGHENYTSPEVQLFLLARKVEPQALLGPYPIPTVETPTDCVDNLNILTDRFVSKELKSLSNKMAVNERKVLVLGQGDNWSQYVGRGELQFLPKTTDNLPFASDAFDVIFAPWTLDKLPSLNRAIKEMVRVARRKGSQLVILQGAPGNEAVMHLNAAARSPQIRHQGQILQEAAHELTEQGFGLISLERVRAHYEFPEEDLPTRCSVAAECLAGMTHRQHPNYKVIKHVLTARMKLHFQGSAHAVGMDMVALVARSSDAENCRSN